MADKPPLSRAPEMQEQRERDLEAQSDLLAPKSSAGQTSGARSGEEAGEKDESLSFPWRWMNRREPAAEGVELAASQELGQPSTDRASGTTGSSGGAFVRSVTETGTQTHEDSDSEGLKSAQILLPPSPPGRPPSNSPLANPLGDPAKDKSETSLKNKKVSDWDIEKGSSKTPAADKIRSKDALVFEGADEPVCRVCHFNLGPSKDEVMDLGCACKNDLAHAHRECAETWFKVRGNRKCEICGDIAKNVRLLEAPPIGNNGSESTTITVFTVQHRYSCQNKPVRVLLAFLIAAFLVPWLFRFAYKQ